MSIENLQKVLDQSKPWERKLGSLYYQKQRRRLVQIAGHYGVNTEQSIGAFCALSPSNDEDGNYRDLVTVILAVKKGKSPEETSVCTYHVNKNKAFRIIRGERPLDVLKGPKVLAFYQNTMCPTDDFTVTVDGHIVNASRGRVIPLNDVASKLTLGQYRDVAQQIRDLAVTTQYRPCQVQSIIWLAWKRINRIRYSPPQLSLWGYVERLNLRFSHQIDGVLQEIGYD